MKIINDGIPQIIYNSIVRKNYKPNPDTFSVTRLIGPPLIRQLEISQWDNIIINASEFLWSFFGQAMHYAILTGAPKESLTEERFEVTTPHGTVVGKPDVYVDKIIYDLKFTSVWAYILGDRKEWEEQLNVYAWLLDHYGFDVDGLRIDLIFRDWQKTRMYKNPDYPKNQTEEVAIPKWSVEKADKYVIERLKLHSFPAQCCTDKERWAKKTQYAVMENGRKTASRVLDTLHEAEAWGRDKAKKGYNIETREGGYTRCKDYCMVRSVCPYNSYKED